MIDIVCVKCGKICGFGESYLLREITAGRLPRCFRCDAFLDPPPVLEPIPQKDGYLGRISDSAKEGLLKALSRH